MPRPLNLIIGEGTVKNQRMGGLGVDSPNMYGGDVTGDPVYMSTQDVDTAAGAVSNVFLPTSSTSSSNNLLILGLLGAGVVFMVLAKGRR